MLLKPFAILLVTLIFLGCKKTAEPHEVDLSIMQTTTPSTALMGSDIKVKVVCSAPDLCYQFKRFDIKQTSTNRYTIQAKATFPNNKDLTCRMAIYYADTSLVIKADTKGLYVLNFYNNTVLFKRDSVSIN